MRHCREYYASGVVAGQTAQFVDEVGNVLMKVEVEGRSVLFIQSPVNNPTRSSLPKWEQTRQQGSRELSFADRGDPSYASTSIQRPLFSS